MLQDLRYAARTLRKAPTLLAVAVVALGLSIGANTAIFTVVNTVLLRSLPYEDPERLVTLVRTRPSGATRGVSIPKFFVWKTAAEDVFESMAVYDSSGPGMSLSHEGEPERIKAIRVSEGFFDLFRTRPARGRFFSFEDDQPGGGRVAVVSHSLWTHRFGAHPELIGRALLLNGEAHTVIGITLPDFEANPPADVWLPLQADPSSTNQAHFLLGAARLRSGTTLETANARMKLVAEESRRRFPDAMAGEESAGVVPMRKAVTGDIQPMLLIIWGAVGLVQIIACANVANLLLMRSVLRAKEMGVRICLGATRSRLLAQLLVESVLLATVGGAVGLLLGTWGLRVLLSMTPPDLPRFAELAARGALDPAVLGFTLLLSVVSGVLFGLTPGLRASQIDLNSALKNDSGHSSPGGSTLRAQGAIVVLEVAVGLVLLVAAGLLVRTAAFLNQVDPGFRSENVLTFKTALSGIRYSTRAAVTQYARTLTERVESVPGVEAAAYVSFLPTEQSPEIGFEILGHDRSASNSGGTAKWRFVSYRYFDVLDLRLVRGRLLVEGDTATAPAVAIVNEAMARKYWANADPLGQRITIGTRLGPGLSGVAREIVGVVGDTRESGLALDPPPVLYMPQPQMSDSFTALTNSIVPTSWVVRVSGSPMTLAERLRREVTAIDPLQASAEWKPMSGVLQESKSTRNFLLLLLIVFAGIALSLAAIGIYGVFSYATEQRTLEIAIRLALGAQPRQVRSLLLVRGLTLASIGIAIGLLAATAASRVLSGMLFGVPATDPLTFIAAAVVLSTVAAVAAWIPAQRSKRVHPATAIRYQ